MTEWESVSRFLDNALHWFLLQSEGTDAENEWRMYAEFWQRRLELLLIIAEGEAVYA